MACVLMTWVGAAPAPAAIESASSRAEACLASIAELEQADPALPAGLLRAIAYVESGRTEPVTGAAVPWPWTINSPAGAFYLDDRATAIAKVRELEQAGVRNIDVGCMQINLGYHPHAFGSLEEAFDPASNVAYAARFLADLRRDGPDLFRAVAHYHSRTRARGDAYARKVYRLWGRPAPVLDSEQPVGTAVARVYRIDPKDPTSWQIRDAGGAWRSGAAVERRGVIRSSAFDDWLTGRPR